MKTYKIRAAIRRSYVADMRADSPSLPEIKPLDVGPVPQWVRDSANPEYEEALWRNMRTVDIIGDPGQGNSGVGVDVGYGFSVQW